MHMCVTSFQWVKFPDLDINHNLFRTFKCDYKMWEQVLHPSVVSYEVSSVIILETNDHFI